MPKTKRMKNGDVYGIMRKMVAAVEKDDVIRYMALVRDQKEVLDGCEAGRHVRRALDHYLGPVSDGIPDRLLRISAAVHNMEHGRYFDEAQKPTKTYRPQPRLALPSQSSP